MRKTIIVMVLCLCIMVGCAQADEQPLQTPTTGSQSIDDMPPSSEVSQLASLSQQATDIVQDIDALDLLDPSDLMIFLKSALSTIEKDRGYEHNSILDYCMEYSVEYRNNRTTIVCTVESGPGALLYIIVNKHTKDYFYFDAAKAFTMYGFDDKEVRFSCQSGETAMQFRNFPFNMTYYIAEDSWKKTHLPINDTNHCDRFDGNPKSFGVLDRVELKEEKIRLVLSFDELIKQNPSLGSPIPVTYYSFDPTLKKATFSFSGIEPRGDRLVTQLQQLEGIAEVDIKEIDVVDAEAMAAQITKATQVTFTVSDEYNLYAEREDTDWDGISFMESNEMHFWIWTEKKV